MATFLSLDALDATTDATSAPRAAVFQPKVKPRARKGGGPVDSVTTSNPAPPPPRQATKPAVASPLITSVLNVTASETPTKASGAQNQPSVIEGSGTQGHPSTTSGADPSTRAESVVAKDRVGELHLVIGNGTPASNDAVTSVEDAEIPTPGAQAEYLSRAGVERPPVAVRSTFPVPTAPSAPSSEGLQVSEGATNDSSISRETRRPDSSKHQKRLSSPRPKASVVRSTRDETEDLSSFKEADSSPQERTTGVLDDEQTPETENGEPVSEVLSTSRRTRKRDFAHATSQARGSRRDPTDPAIVPKIDLSLTDLSNPGKLTMREIIRRAEAIDRKKAKTDVAKKALQNDGRPKQALSEPAERDALSMAPQVQVIDGRIVINEQSLTIGAYATSRQNTETYTRVEENASRLNYNSYSNRTPTERWKSEETDLFYRALQQFGTDFELIQNLFPGRTRRQVKAKFKKEERNNPRRLQDALAHRPKDQVHYTDMISRLKVDEADQAGDDPFASILAYASEQATDDGGDMAPA